MNAEKQKFLENQRKCGKKLELHLLPNIQGRSKKKWLEKRSRKDFKERFGDKWQKGEKQRAFYAENKETSLKNRMVGLREMKV